MELSLKFTQLYVVKSNKYDEKQLKSDHFDIILYQYRNKYQIISMTNAPQKPTNQANRRKYL